MWCFAPSRAPGVVRAIGARHRAGKQDQILSDARFARQRLQSFSIYQTSLVPCPMSHAIQARTPGAGGHVGAGLLPLRAISSSPHMSLSPVLSSHEFAPKTRFPLLQDGRRARAQIGPTHSSHRSSTWRTGILHLGCSTLARLVGRRGARLTNAVWTMG